LIEECHLTQEQVAQKVGKDRATVANFMRLLKLPRRIQESAQIGELSMGHARALLGIEREQEQLELWSKIIKSHLSVRQVEQAVKKLNQPPTPKSKHKEISLSSAYIEDTEDRLRKRLATKVKIKPKSSGGSIDITYFDDDDLDRLIHTILGE
jgi:ParB family chromosome partitioning protein